MADLIQVADRTDFAGDLARAIISARRWATQSNSPNAGAALIYLNHLTAAEREGGSEGVRVQFLYILSNLGGWRGAEAKIAKAVFNEAMKRIAENGKIKD